MLHDMIQQKGDRWEEFVCLFVGLLGGLHSTAEWISSEMGLGPE